MIVYIVLVCQDEREECFIDLVTEDFNKAKERKEKLSSFGEFGLIDLIESEVDADPLFNIG